MTPNQRLQTSERRSKHCPSCGKGPLVEEGMSGELVCGNCGVVIESLVGIQPDWQAFPDGWSVASRIGAPSTLAMYDKGLATTMDRGVKDASGKGFTSSEKARIERMRLWDRRIQVHETVDRNLRRAFTQLDRLAKRLNPSVAMVERAAYIYRKAVKGNLIRGRSTSSMIAASLYISCRSTEIPRNLKDVAKASGASKKDIARCYRLLLKELDLKMPLIDPIRSISRIASKAGVSEKAARRAMGILRKAKDTRITAGKNSQGLAAAALYIACTFEGESSTQKEVAGAAGVTEATVRNRLKALQRITNRDP